MRNLLWPMLMAAPMVLAMAGSAAAQAPQGAIYVVTYVELQPAAAKSGAALLRQYRDGARKAGGNIEAAFGEEIGRTNRFVLVEGWRDQASFDAHEKADVTLRVRQSLQAIALNPPDQRVNTGFDLAPGAGPGALLVATHVDVAPPGREATEAALHAEAAAIRRDQGNLRCDVFQQLAPRLNHFNMVALWRSREDFQRHELQAHRAQFRQALAPLLGALYDERLYTLM